MTEVCMEAEAHVQRLEQKLKESRKKMLLLEACKIAPFILPSQAFCFDSVINQVATYSGRVGICKLRGASTRIKMTVSRYLVQEFTTQIVTHNSAFADEAQKKAKVLEKIAVTCDATVVAAVTALLEFSAPHVRYSAVRILEKIAAKDDAATIKAVATRLRSKRAEVRQAAVLVLGEIADSESSAVISTLTACFDDVSPNVRQATLTTVARIATHTELGTAAKVAHGLADRDARTRLVAVDALITLAERKHQGTLQAAIFWLKDHRAEVRIAALNAVVRLHLVVPTVLSEVAAAEVNSNIIALTKDHSAEVRKTAVFVAGKLAELGDAATEVLLDRLTDDDSDVCLAALQVLVDIVPTESIGDVELAVAASSSLRYATLSTRQAATKAVSQMKKRAES